MWNYPIHWIWIPKWENNKEYKHFKSNFSLIIRHVGPVWSPWLCIPGGHKTNVVGTMNMLGLAKRVGARFLVTSTSEVYGDPLQHPQVETYWGNVNPIGKWHLLLFLIDTFIVQNFQLLTILCLKLWNRLSLCNIKTITNFMKKKKKNSKLIKIYVAIEDITHM